MTPQSPVAAADPQREPALDRRHLVEPEHLEIRAQTAWRRVQEAREERRQRRQRRAFLVGVGGVGLAAAAAAFLLFYRPEAGAPDPTTWAGATLRTGGEPTKVALADGSEIDARPDSELALLDAPRGEVRVALRRGGATFEVTRRQDRPRRFVVEAGNVEVRVLGTRFVVDRQRGADGTRRVEVSVVRGLVEVALGDRETRRLGAGERWSVVDETADAPADDAPADGPGDTADDTLAGAAAAVDPGPLASADPETTPEGTLDEEPAEPRRRGAEARHRRREASGGGAGAPDAAALIARAKDAARAGDPGGAAQAYEALLRAHPRDPRASLAAFELGRLRMDRLGDRPGAVRAFRRALTLGRASPLRQDALRRLVELYDTLGNDQACRRMRERYLADHPDGRYAREVGRRCADGR